MRYKNKSMKLNAILNMFKQICNIIFPLITYPYVSRVLGATNLGKYSFADSVVQYFIILATLGASGYAIREGARFRDESENIQKFSSEIFSINIITLMISLILLVVCVFFVPRINQVKPLIFILSINIIFTVIGRDWINSIYEDFSYITIRYIIFQIISMILMFVLVRITNDYYKYTMIVVLATSGAQALNIIHTSKYVPYRLSLTKNSIKHLKPIMFMFCISIASIIYINSDVTLLGFLRSENEVGIYYIVGKIYTIIKTLMNALIMVTVPRLAYYLGKNEYEKYNDILDKLRNVLLIITLPCIVGVFLLSENIVMIIGGQEFISGSISLKILCIAMFFAVIGCFYSQSILIPNRKEKYFFFATIVSAVVNIGLNFLFIPIWGINGAAITTVIAEIIVVLICSYYSKGQHKKFTNGSVRDAIVGCMAIVIVCQLVKMFVVSVMLQLVISIIVSVIIYAVILLGLKNEILYSVVGKYINRSK